MQETFSSTGYDEIHNLAELWQKQKKSREIFWWMNNKDMNMNKDWVGKKCTSGNFCVVLTY